MKKLHGNEKERLERDYPASAFFASEAIKMEYCSFRKGEVFTYPGYEPHCLVIILSGTIRWSAYRNDGSVFVLSMEEKEIIGDLEFLSSRPSAIYAEAVSDGTAAIVDTARYASYLRNDPEFLHGTISKTARKMEELIFSSAYQTSLEERILTYMEHSRDRTLSNITMAASSLHTSRRHLQRLLKELCEKDILIKTGRGCYKMKEIC